jgi:Fe-S-cluster containining protein
VKDTRVHGHAEMSEVKQKILAKILAKYAEWTVRETFFCRKGCALCCTQNVMISAVEGRSIYDYIMTRKMEKWFGERLSTARQTRQIRLTTNGFARLCLARSAEDGDETPAANAGICPFLAADCCTIYAVRPFACRSFASTHACRASGAASLSERLLVLNTVTMQLIEHVGQREYWGNMLDVLLVQSLHRENLEVKKYIGDDSCIDAALARMLRAEPIPGFLLKPEEEHEVQEYLHAVLAENIGSATVGDILNNTAQ